MNIRTAILALIPLTIQAAPVLMPDGVNLDPNDPGINATVYGNSKLTVARRLERQSRIRRFRFQRFHVSG
jgi:hypothetical protein